MAEQMTFKRYEIKYMLTQSEFRELRKVMDEYMVADEHGRSTNCSLYFDTLQFLMIRRSMEHPVYKEKLRVRSYGVAAGNSTVFVELKKKYRSVTYKRRLAMEEDDMERYLVGGNNYGGTQGDGLSNQSIKSITDGMSQRDLQIKKEIDYVLRTYDGLAPAMMLSYDRQAFYGRDDHEFRMTFDENILWRDYDLTLTKGIYGLPLLQQDQVLLEIKTAMAYPLWLVRFLNDKKIYRTSFSKYANAYRAKEEKIYA